MTLVTIRLGERAEIVRPSPAPARSARRGRPILAFTLASAATLAVVVAVTAAGRPAPVGTAPVDPPPRDEIAFLRAAHAEAAARAATLAAAMEAMEARLAATVPPPDADDVRTTAVPDAPESPARMAEAAAALAALETRTDWLAAALAAETALRRAVEAEAAAASGRHDALATAAEELARLLEASIDDRLEPVRQLLAAVRLEGPALARVLAAAPGTGGPLVPVPAGAEDLPLRLPPAAGARLRSAMDGAQALRTLCRLADRIPAGMPVAATGRSSGFGRRIDPFTRQPAFHTGVDLNAPVGTPVTASAPGRVADVSRHPEYGLVVDVDHGFGIVTRYAHLSSALVRKGASIAAGNPVGLVGRTGRSTGDHLHYEVMLGGRAVDPSHFLDARRHVCEAW